MTEYIEALSEIDPEWEEKMDSGEVKAKAGMGQSVSTMLREDPEVDDAQKTVFDWCVEGCKDKVADCIAQNQTCLSETDENVSDRPQYRFIQSIRYEPID